MNAIKKKYYGYHIGLSVDFSDQQLNILTDLFDRRPEGAVSVFGGRSSVASEEIPGIGPIVVKYYFRGGLIRHLNKRRYVKCGKTRSQKEFELLENVRTMGVRAPEPLAFAYQGFPLYRAWLVTRRIDTNMSLADLSVRDAERACNLVENMIEQLLLLIQNGILHVDFHPGNVLADVRGGIHIVDFDKGRIYPGTPQQLMKRYRARWKRAIIKHDLPSSLWEVFDAKLMANLNNDA